MPCWLMLLYQCAYLHLPPGLSLFFFKCISGSPYQMLENYLCVLILSQSFGRLFFSVNIFGLRDTQMASKALFLDVPVKVFLEKTGLWISRLSREDPFSPREWASCNLSESWVEPSGRLFHGVIPLLWPSDIEVPVLRPSDVGWIIPLHNFLVLQNVDGHLRTSWPLWSNSDSKCHLYHDVCLLLLLILQRTLTDGPLILLMCDLSKLPLETLVCPLDLKRSCEAGTWWIWTAQHNFWIPT